MFVLFPKPDEILLCEICHTPVEDRPTASECDMGDFYWCTKCIDFRDGYAVKRTKKRPCCGPGCSERRIHWSEPFTPRGIINISVPYNYPDNKPCYCSIECWCYGENKNIKEI